MYNIFNFLISILQISDKQIYCLLKINPYLLHYKANLSKAITGIAILMTLFIR